MPAVQETVDQVRRDRRRPVQVWVRDADRIRQGPEGPVRGHRPLHLGQEGRAGMDAGVAARRLPALADHARAELGARSTTARSTTRTSITTPRRSRRRRSRSTRSIRRFSRPTRSSAFRCASRSCSASSVGAAEDGEAARLRRVAVDAVFDSVSVATTFKAELAKAGVIFMPISEAIREHPELVKKYLGSVVPVSRQFLRHAQFGGVLRRLLRLRAAGRALPDGAVDLFPHQRAQYRPVRAHADHRRQGLLCELSRRLHRADARREPAARRRGRAGRARRRRDQIFDRAELVSGRRQGPRRHLQFRHQARRLPRHATRRFPGPRSRPARRSPGNIRAASCAATIRAASSTRSPSPTAASRSIPAPR